VLPKDVVAGDISLRRAPTSALKPALSTDIITQDQKRDGCA
jgi:hypothetical protein